MLLGQGSARFIRAAAADSHGPEHVSTEVGTQIGRPEEAVEVWGNRYVGMPGAGIDSREIEVVERLPEGIIVGAIGEVPTLESVGLGSVRRHDHHARQRYTASLLGVEQPKRFKESLAVWIGDHTGVSQLPTFGHAGLAALVINTDRHQLCPGVVYPLIIGGQPHELATAIWSPVASVGHEHERPARSAQIEKIGEDGHAAHSR